MLEWNVFVGGFNSREIEVRNVFNHHGFWNDLVKIAKKYNKARILPDDLRIQIEAEKADKESFAEAVRTSLMYYYWSKCEWEVIIDHWPQRDGWNDRKVDVYEQVSMNWDRFIDYLWEHRREIKAKKE